LGGVGRQYRIRGFRRCRREPANHPFPAQEGTIDADGFVGGVHAGYNLQAERLVIGIEGDVEASDVDGDTDALVIKGDVPFATQAKEYDWLASIRLRAGYAMDSVLFYATGGVAFAGVDMSFDIPNVDFRESETETAFGITVGGGIEFALTDNLTCVLNIAIPISRTRTSAAVRISASPNTNTRMISTRCVAA
jgi:opacity protein-like surface antigen